MSDAKISNNCIISNSVVGPKSILRNGCKVTFGSVLGANVELNKETFVENSLVQSKKPEERNYPLNVKCSFSICLYYSC